MWSPEHLRRTLRRRDAFARLVASSVLVLLLSAGGLGLYAWAAMESLEEADRWMQFSLAMVREAFSQSGSPELTEEVADLLLKEDVAGRIRQGEDIRSWGEWPPSESLVPTLRGDDRRDLGALRLLREDGYLLGRLGLARGGTVELALSLRRFAQENRETGSLILLITATACVGAVLLSLASIHLAFVPLRRATTLVREVDARSLGSRLPTRSTADPVDRHAEALNQVLDKIESSFSRLRAFSADVAHELRTPINRMHNVVEVALHSGEEAELRAALETVEKTTGDLARMVDSLLLLAEIDERRLQPRLVAIDAQEWIRGALDFYAPLFEERGTTLASRIGGGRILGDRPLLDRVLVNLLENALEHTGEGDKVEVRAEDSGTRFELWVEDSGPGITAPDRERVFDRFVRLGSNDHKGFGLGLALARAIAQLHGGTLVVEESPLGGARLALELPVRAAA